MLKDKVSRQFVSFVKTYDKGGSFSSDVIHSTSSFIQLVGYDIGSHQSEDRRILPGGFWAFIYFFFFLNAFDNSISPVINRGVNKAQEKERKNSM
jgi:hypothetical protein